MITEQWTGVKEAWRMFKRARRVKRTGFKKYEGTPEEMCHAIIKDTYKNGFFQVSNGHFCEYYVRDFAFCCEALVHLGYKEEVDATVRFALGRFKEKGKVATMITPYGKAYDFPGYGPDALGLFLYTLTHTGNSELAKKNKTFLQGQVDIFVKKVLDSKTLLPKQKRFTSIRDQAKRKASCYDAVMIAVVARECEALGLHFPAKFKEVKKRIEETYWNGTYFFSDTRKQDIVIGDANVFPFWTGVFTETAMVSQALDAMQSAGLDERFPLRYVSRIDKHREKVSWHFAAIFTPDYETDSIYMHLGNAYLRVLAAHDKKRARMHLKMYTDNLLKYGTFLEMYNDKGAPYETPFYITDEAMIWCASYLDLAKKLNVI